MFLKEDLLLEKIIKIITKINIIWWIIFGGLSGIITGFIITIYRILK